MRCFEPTILVVALLVALTSASCGGDSSESGSSTAQDTGVAATDASSNSTSPDSSADPDSDMGGGGADSGDVGDDSSEPEDSGEPEDTSDPVDTSEPEDTAVADTAPEDTSTEDTEVADTEVADTTPDTAPEDTTPDEPDAPEYDCDSFSASEGPLFVLPQEFAQISAWGGSGSYRWDFAPDGNASGAELDALSGRYLSGRLDPDEERVSDMVEVHDVGCELMVMVEVRVVKPAALRPQFPELTVGQRVCFEIDGGSGRYWAEDSPFTWELNEPAGSGELATLRSDGCYTAGEEPGIDIITVHDTQTDQYIQTAISVFDEGGTRLRASAPALMLPVREQHAITLEGGTGVFYPLIEGPNPSGLVVQPSPERPDNTFIVQAGDASGVQQVVFQDSFVPENQLIVPISVMARGEHRAHPYHAPSNDNDIATLNVNNDAYDDAVVGVRTAGVNGTNSGAVFVYLGGQIQEDDRLGLGRTPTQVIAGVARNVYLGRSLTSGDFNNDGCPDLAIGVWGDSSAGSRAGEVQIWTGCNDEPRSDETVWSGRLDDNAPASPEIPPLALWRHLPGLGNNNYLGWSVIVGDFNGDGLDDLAAGAQRANAPTRLDPADNTPWNNLGRVYVYLNKGTVDGELIGLPTQPDVFIDGVDINDDGSYGGRDNMYFGDRLAAADMNGDGCSDLLVGSALANGNRGFVSLYLSGPDEEFGGDCLIANEPSLAMYPGQDNSRRTSLTGWRVELADVSGDCLPDIVFTQATAPIFGGSNSSAGAVNVFFGRAAWSEDGEPVKLYIGDPAPEGDSRVIDGAPDWVYYGEPSDQLGYGLDVGDENGDGLPDLLVGALTAEGPETSGDNGEILLFRGAAQKMCGQPHAEELQLFEEPIIVSSVPNRAGDRMGRFVGFIGDVDGDDDDDWMAWAEGGSSGAPDDLTNHESRLFWHAGGLEAPGYENFVTVERPLPAQDDQFGGRVRRVGDINDDGFDDFAVSGYNWDFLNTTLENLPYQTLAGGVFLYFGGPDGLRATPDMLVAGHNHHTGSDRFGYALDAAGDVNGDGIDDMVITALDEDLVGACQTCRINGAYRGQTGAVYVYLGREGLGERFAGDDLAQLPMLSAPDFVACGPPSNNDRMSREVAGGFDYDGDGRDDLLVSNWNRPNQRGMIWSISAAELLAAPDGTLCADDTHMIGEGDNNGDYLGYGLTALDLDGDGCDDRVAGAYNADPPGRANAGRLRVWMGHGPTCARAASIQIDLVGERNGDNIGRRLAATGDVNGDGVGDIAVTSTGYGSRNLWSVIVYSGAALSDAVGTASDGDAFILSSTFRLAEIASPSGETGTSFGDGLTALGDINDDGLMDFFVGARQSNYAGEINAGAAFVYLGSRDLDELAAFDAVLTGETALPDGFFGSEVAGARVGDSVWLLVGAPFSEWPGPEGGELGAFYTGVLDLP